MMDRQLPKDTPRRPVPAFEPPRSRPAWARNQTAAPDCSQAEARTRRRQWLSVNYGSGFDLGVEVREIAGPLATAVAVLPNPRVLREETAAVWGAAIDVIGWAVKVLAGRGRADEHAVRRFAGLDRAAMPDTALTTGSWADDLAAAAEPFTGPLRGELGRDTSPSRARGETLSGELLAVLRPLDSAAHLLASRTNRAARVQARGSHSEHRARVAAQRQDDRTAARMTELGIKQT